MKHLLIVVAFLAATIQIYAQGNQCPGCAINPACNNPSANFPALCPDVLPNGTQGQSYTQDITFYMPFIIDAEGFTGLNLEEVTILGISGMPAGLSWTSSAYPTNFYDISSDPNTQRGCVQICGTPGLSGSYNASVNVLVKVCNVPVIGCTTMTQTFVLPLVIDPPAGGNPYFTFNPSTGCGSVDVDFNALVNIGSPQVTEYEWDFDNGNTSNLQHPPVQSYGAVGEYHPTLVTNVYNYVFNALSANVTGGWWCGDIEEFNCGSGNADLKFTLTHGGGVYNSSEVPNTITPSWNNLGVVLSSLTIAIQFTEVDNGPPFGSANDNGGTYAFIVPGEGTYNFSTTAVTSGGGGVNGNFTIIKQLFNSFVTTDTLTVYDLPPILPIVSSTGSFDMCSDSPITLSVDTGYTYQWYLNDTTILIGADSSSYVVPDPGNYPATLAYKVKITDPNTGCAVITPNVTVTISEAVTDLFGTFGASYSGGVLSTNYSYPHYQWYFNGTSLAPNGQSQTLVPTQNGNYYLVVTTNEGCSATSNVVTVANVDIDDFDLIGQNILVYPNPSNGMFTMQVNADVKGGAVVSMVDISGKTVYAENLGKMNGGYTKTFNLQHLASGVYTLNIAFEQGTVRKKVIIQ